MIRTILFILTVAFLSACGQSGDRNPEYLPEATGSPGDIIVVMDSTQWRGALGAKVREVLSAEVKGLPREETLFNVIPVHPSQKIYLLTQVRNLMYVFTIDERTQGSNAILRTFTPETIADIESDTSFFVNTAENVHSRGQQVMYLFGKNEGLLIDKIADNSNKIVDFFNQAERERLKSTLFDKASKQVTAFLREEQNFGLKIPYGYQLADKQDKFIWFRRMELDVDKNVWITWKPYESEYQLRPDSLLAWREEVARQHLFGDPEDRSSFVVTEMEVPFNPVVAKQTQLGGNFAMELKGLWRTNNKSMGGPFVSYAVVDQEQGRVYYLEGFVYSPSKSQRETMRQLETILQTFEASDQLALQQ